MAWIKLCIVWLIALSAQATEIVRVPGIEIRIQPFPSTFLTPDVARQYQLERSRRQTLINLVVVDTSAGPSGPAIPAQVSGFVRNLLGQTQPLNFKEINEGEGAIYYLAPVRVSSEETLRFAMTVTPRNTAPIEIQFEHRVYVD
ncbi:MAG: DUF4426 domain-containing protein [Gammaproteobacteria bacterium]|nr:DUF4426 domain-containing protein [Gammaproteobacteria bacterium]